MILQTTGTWNDEVVSSIERESNAATDDYPGFMEQKREIIEKYLEYIKSEAYQQSPGYKMKQLILEFQRASGYTEVFIENMKLLSRDYAQHLEKLRQANELFLSEYPEAAGLLGRE